MLDVPGFLRAFQMRAGSIMWFLGAGASRAAGIPTAGDMIWDFKQRLYRSHKKLPPSAITDAGDEIVRQKLQRYFDSLGGFPVEGSDDEYSAYFEATYPSPKDRRAYLDQLISKGSLSIYQRKHNGESPRRIVVHKNTQFRHDEIEGVFDAFPSAQNIELVHVQGASGWRGVYISAPKRPHGYPCKRGSALQLGENEVLLWTQGNLPAIAGGKDYFKEGKGIPEPLLLTRYAGLGTLDDLCQETLGLTKMDWNNDGPYDRLPVTLNFAGTLAAIVKQMPRLEARPYPIRLFM